MSVATFLIPSQLLVAVPILNIIAVACIRSETADSIPGSSTTALIPIVCLGFYFGIRGVLVATVGASLVTASSCVREAEFPQAGTDWMAALALPSIALALSLIGLRTAKIFDEQEVERALLLGQVTRQLAITRGVLESVDAAVAFFDPARRPLFANAQAIQISEHAGVDVRRPELGARFVWREDRVHRLRFEEQPLVAVLAGREVSPELLWVGPDNKQIAILVSARRIQASDTKHVGVG